MRDPTAPLDDGHDVRGPQATRAGMKGTRATVAVFHRPAEGIRPCRSYIQQLTLLVHFSFTLADLSH